MEKNKQYQTIKNWLVLVNLVLFLLVNIFILSSGLSLYLKAISFRFSSNYYLTLVIYLVLFGLILYLINLPLSFYEDFVLEHKFGLSTQKFSAWFDKEIKKIIVSSLLCVPLILVLYFFLKNFSNIWWVIVGGVWFLFSILLTKIVPIIILPIFYKYKPLDNQALKQRIINLADKCKIKIMDVSYIDAGKETKKANAAVIGLGKTRRIILWDTLTSTYTNEEIEMILAHEFGHHVLKHMPKLLMFNLFSIFGSLFLVNVLLSKLIGVFWLANIYDIAGLPLILLILFLFSLIIMPLQNWFSRCLEFQADIFALKLTMSKETFISMMQKLANQNLADPNPNRFIEIMLYDHPPIGKRVRLASEVKL